MHKFSIHNDCNPVSHNAGFGLVMSDMRHSQALSREGVQDRQKEGSKALKSVFNMENRFI